MLVPDSEITRAVIMTFDITRPFRLAIDLVFGLILIVLVVAIAAGAVKLGVQLIELLPDMRITGGHQGLITDVLTLFVLIELSRSLVDYFKVQRLRMTFIVDAAIVFVIREIMIEIFQDHSEVSTLYALTTLLAVFTLLRIGSILVYQRELQMVASTGGSNTK